MKNIKFSLILFMCTVALLLAGCSELAAQVSDTDFGTSVELPEASSYDNVHIRDKKLLYKNQNNTEIVTMYLTVSKGNAAEGTNHTWEEINTYSVYDYDRMGVDRYKVAGLLQVGDENGLVKGELGYGQVAPNCTVQVRGQTSSRMAQKNYKISVKDNKGSWRGQQTIALNKHQTDGLRFRNKMGFDLLSGIDELMSLRTTFVHLYVKDLTQGNDATFEDYGLYTQVEQLNKTALETHGLDKRGHLYKINTCEFYRYEDVIKLQSDPTFDQKAFDEILECKGNDDHSKLINLLEMLNDYSIPIETILDKHLDVENIAYWMAFHILMGNTDTQNRNFYFYSPLNSERWYILNWDLDGALRTTEVKIQNRSDHGGWEMGVSNYWGNIMFRRCLKSEVFRKELDKAIEDVYAYLSKERIENISKTYSELVKPYVYSGRDLLHAPITPEMYDYIVSQLHNDIEDNYVNYKISLEKPLPFFIGTPYKENGKILLEWDASYDFDNDNITYTVELAKDCNFEKTVFKQEDIIVPTVQFDMLPEGQYFVRVTSKDENNLKQTAFDYYMTSIGKVYGTKCFYVDAGGKIVEDVYVES